MLFTSLAGLDGGAPAARYQFERPEMGTLVRIVLCAPDEGTAGRAADAAFGRIEELNSILSDYDAESELCRLCRDATADHAVPVSRDLWRVLARARDISVATGGAFDITVGPVVGLWRQARVLQRKPADDRVREAMTRVGYRKVLLDRETRSARLAVPNIRLDLGGIAKGYAAHEALNTLARHGVTRALVCAGGEIAAGLPPPGEAGWRVAVAPLGDEEPSTYLAVSRCAVSTSGDKWQYAVFDGVRYSHIIDPRTGVPVVDRRSVTVVSRDAMTADAWATALNVLGPAEAATRANAAGVSAYCVYRRGDEVGEFQSNGWRALLRAGVARHENRTVGEE
jgi:thiamine biosynthesis lipoprotein